MAIFVSYPNICLAITWPIYIIILWNHPNSLAKHAFLSIPTVRTRISDTKTALLNTHSIICVFNISGKSKMLTPQLLWHQLLGMASFSAQLMTNHPGMNNSSWQFLQQPDFTCVPFWKCLQACQDAKLYLYPKYYKQW